jgi:hypothetical protein
MNVDVSMAQAGLLERFVGSVAGENVIRIVGNL